VLSTNFCLPQLANALNDFGGIWYFALQPTVLRIERDYIILPHTFGLTVKLFEDSKNLDFNMKGDVCNQTAAIFERTGSRSLVVAGATRYSVRGNHTLSCQPKNAIADAAHNNLTMFHTMCVGVYEASNNGIFMQWHGQQSW